MTFKTHLDEAAFREEISRWSKPGKTPDYPTKMICCKDELIGGINGSRFWLKKIRPQLGNTPQRVFYGKIIRENDCVIVRGRFRYVQMIRYACLSLFLIALGLYIALKSNQAMNFTDFCKGLFTMLFWSALLFEFFNVVNILTYIREEIFVIKYLKSL